MLNSRQISQFKEQGFLVFRGFNSTDKVAQGASRFEPLFRGIFETGLQPDEWNWRHGISDESLTRQICNGWKSDRAVARLVLDVKVGQACAELMGWSGTRINQDNILWKPPGAKSVGFHQDESYQQWIEPSSMVTCWMALDSTTKHGGTIEYVKGSNHWPVETRKFTFHAPLDYQEGLKYAARTLGITDYQIESIEVQAGDVVFHHGRTWHGSGPNRTDIPRRSVVAHCMSAESRFHPEIVGPIYGRYKRYGSTEMDESFFPVIYRQDGYRSCFLSSLAAY